MGSKYLIRYLILIIALAVGAGTSLGQLASSSSDYLGTPVYYSDTRHLPGMPMSQPVYGTGYPSSYYTSQVNYTGGDWLGTPVYYSDTRHLPGTSYLGQPAYIAPYVPSYYSGFYPYSAFGYGPANILTGFGMTGRVVDVSGNGIPGAQVILTNIYDTGIFTTTTNSLGYYGINAPDGFYYVTARLPGYTFSQSTGRIAAGFVSPAPTIVGSPAPASGAGAVAAGSYGTQAQPTAYGAQTPQSAAYGSQPSTPTGSYGTPTPAVTYAA